MRYRFDDHTLDTSLYEMRWKEDLVSVEPQVFDLLVYLIGNRGRVVTRDELLENLWPGKVVTDSALNVRIKRARKAVGDPGPGQAIIKTIYLRNQTVLKVLTEALRKAGLPD